MFLKRNGRIVLALVCCTFLFAFFTTPAFSTPTYEMAVAANGGQIFGGTTAVTELNNALSGITDNFVWPGGSPTSSIPSFSTTPLPAGSGTTVTGYWEFSVTSSTAGTGSPNWNDVMAGGSWLFSIDWSGQVGGSPMSAEFNITNTFANIYGQWAENNPNMYTLFGLYTDPAAGGASTPGSVVGLFAFAGNDSPSFDLTALRNALEITNSPLSVGPGTGTMTATPEPATMVLLGLGLLCAAGVSRRKKLN
jgi:hypothetical protein